MLTENKTTTCDDISRGLFYVMQWHDGPVPNWPPPINLKFKSQPKREGVLSNGPMLGGGWGVKCLRCPLILQQTQEVAVSEVTSHLKLKNRAFLGKRKPRSLFLLTDARQTVVGLGK